MNNTKFFLLIGTFLSLIPQTINAQCVATQDCATLGYTETSCSGGSGVKCPFGNKWACFKSESECEQQFCDKYGFIQTCTGANQTGGAGAACGGKYASCKCASGYEWKDDGCKQQAINGAQGELFYCNGKVVGVRATGMVGGMGFYVAMNDLGRMGPRDAITQCESYSFCGDYKGTLPTREQLLTLYNNKSQVNTLLLANGGAQLADTYYWSSTSRAGTGGNMYVVNMVDGSVKDTFYGYPSATRVLPILASY